MSLTLESKLGMGLDDIIAAKTKARRTGPGPVRRSPAGAGTARVSSSSNRDRIRDTEISSSGGNRRRASSSSSNSRRTSAKNVSLKFLIDNKLAGSFIGSQGRMIKEFQEVTGISAHISDSDKKFPGSDERVIYLSGNGDGVSLAVNLLWELLANSDDWRPRTAAKNASDADKLRVSGRVTIPVDAAGAVIGKGGSYLQSIKDETGANVNIGRHDEAPETKERTVSMSGTVIGCVKATLMILDKMIEEDEAKYTFPGSGYGAAPREEREGNNQRGGGGVNSKEQQLKGRNSASGGRLSSREDREEKYGATTLKTLTTVQMAVENSLVGNIMGKQGSTLRELMSSTDTTITVSKQGDYVSGTKRLITITGSARDARSAQLRINKLVDV